MFAVRSDYQVVFWNRCMEDWTGISSNEITGKNLGIFFPNLMKPAYNMRLNTIFSGGPPAIFSSQLHGNIISSKLHGGLLRIMQTTVIAVPSIEGEGFYALFSIEDVSDLSRRVQEYNKLYKKAIKEIKQREQAEKDLKAVAEQLQINRKMEALGTMAGGFAHDFNNLLTGIMGNVELLNLDRDDFSEQQKECIDRSLQGMLNAATLIRKIQEFVNGKVAQKEKIDIYNCIASAMDKFKDIKINFRKENLVQPQKYFIKANHEDMERIFMGLIKNALEAITKKGANPNLFVQVNAEECIVNNNNILEKNSVKNNIKGLANGRYVHIVVEDNGCGMSDKVRERAFDPFFSGKDKGTQKGQGLGLAMVYSIVMFHGGCIFLESNLGVGTVCHLYLPAL
ncbi:MAG: hypothetical protein B6I31_03195 [Desulfobacteraceae bacterium 4572_19]|nr:MAG: hypothetical protein B6I31_03195 [Desulfobacteraceae bacterium 4572_19]